MDDLEGPITSVARLLAPHDRQFLQAAYLALLGRAPDPTGEAFYLAQLRAGQHKLAILKQLRRSDEGRAFVPGVAGLDRAIKRHQLATLPVVGPLVRLFTGWEGNGALQRQLRIMANELGRMHAQQAATTSAIHQLAVEQRPAMPSPVPAPASLPTPQSLQRQALPLGDTGDAQSCDSWGRAMDSKEQRLLEILRQSALRRGSAA